MICLHMSVRHSACVFISAAISGLLVLVAGGCSGRSAPATGRSGPDVLPVAVPSHLDPFPPYRDPVFSAAVPWPRLLGRGLLDVGGGLWVGAPPVPGCGLSEVGGFDPVFGDGGLWVGIPPMLGFALLGPFAGTLSTSDEDSPAFGGRKMPCDAGDFGTKGAGFIHANDPLSTTHGNVAPCNDFSWSG